MWMKTESDALRSAREAPHALAPKARQPKGRMPASVVPREVLAGLLRGVAKPQVKLLIGVSHPYRTSGSCSAIEKRKVSGPFDHVFETEGARVIRTPLRAPRANAFAERFVRTVRRDCLDHVLIYGRQPLERVLQAYVAHYIQERPHRGLSFDRTRRPPNTAGLGTTRLVERRGRARRSDSRVLLGGVIRIVEPFRRRDSAGSLTNH
jgi:putative transposase